ncbi:hypothetical protein GCM10022399_14350 [Terrabacter ginsenosidimutans]|uniref:Uncharacterized protein n=1 Tax=Terrabacter ginsenosidimutans TaxID=490575 RepID=A0ABP7D3N9_9MICO
MVSTSPAARPTPSTADTIGSFDSWVAEHSRVVDRTLSPSLHELATHQHGLLTRRQLLDGGVTPAAGRRRQATLTL